MKEFEFLLNIDNKEILTEILNHSIDFLIENQNEKQTMHMCHKYGFYNPDDFLLATKCLAKFYQELCCCEEGEISDAKLELKKLSPDLQSIMGAVLRARHSEVLRYLVRAQNASEYPLVEWFDWGTNLILGDSSFASNSKMLTTVTLHLRETKRNSDGIQTLHFQMNREKLDELISTMEQMVKEFE